MSKNGPSMNEITIEATVTVLVTELGLDPEKIREDPADAIAMYLETLPDDGPIRGKKPKNIIKGLTYLIDEVDPDHREYEQLLDSLRDAVARSQ